VSGTAADTARASCARNCYKKSVPQCARNCYKKSVPQCTRNCYKKSVPHASARGSPALGLRFNEGAVANEVAVGVGVGVGEEDGVVGVPAKELQKYREGRA
jgi:hypothetical protein